MEISLLWKSDQALDWMPSELGNQFNAYKLININYFDIYFGKM